MDTVIKIMKGLTIPALAFCTLLITLHFIGQGYERSYGELYQTLDRVKVKLILMIK